MPTLNQKRVAKKMVEALQSEELVTGKEILADIGYSPGIQKNPKMILESEGVREELMNLGLDVDETDKVVKAILHTGEDNNRLKAADMIYKRLGSYAAEKKLTVNLNADIEKTDPALIELAEEYEEKLKQRLADGTS